jgi:hypothetical protein
LGAEEKKKPTNIIDTGINMVSEGFGFVDKKKLKCLCETCKDAKIKGFVDVKSANSYMSFNMN